MANFLCFFCDYSDRRGVDATKLLHAQLFYLQLHLYNKVWKSSPIKKSTKETAAK